jgi:hypothetical protein
MSSVCCMCFRLAKFQPWIYTEMDRRTMLTNLQNKRNFFLLFHSSFSLPAFVYPFCFPSFFAFILYFSFIFALPPSFFFSFYSTDQLWTGACIPRVREIENSDCYFHNINKFLWDVEAPTFCRKSSHRWRWCCQPYVPAVPYPQEDSWYSFLLEAESTPGP